MLPAPKEISSLFFETAVVPDAISVLDYTHGRSIEHPQTSTVSPEDEDFVGKYFGEGIRPIIWFDASDPNAKLWAIVTILWPALRRSFSACTLCLQPRSLQGRIFDVMFAPRAASSRFSRLSADHFIDSSPLTREPWQNEFAMQLSAGGFVDPESKLLTSALDDNPSSIRKTFLFRELWKRSSEKPTAAIGVFDLLESVNAPETVSQLQNTALNRAVSSFDSLSSSERLELFSMLLRRIPRVRIEGYRQEVFFENFLASVMDDVLREFPQEVLSAIERMMPNLKGAPGLKAIFIGKLAAALPGNPSLSVAIAGCSDIGKEILAEYTPAFAKALNAPESKLLREQTIEWLNEVPFRELLPNFRVSLLRHLKADQDLVLFKRSLTDIRKEEVVPVLNLFFKGDALPYRKHETREAIIDSIARPYPVLTREWIQSLDRRDEVLAEVISVTHPPNATEYREVLSSAGPDPGFRRLVFANWIVRNSAYNSRFVSELTDLASHDLIILDSLIGSECEGVPEKALQVILESLGLISPLSEPLLRKILLYQSRNLKLVDLATRSVITDYVRSGANAAALQSVLGQNQFVEWLTSGRNWRFTGLIRATVSAPESCSRAWEVLSKLPNPTFMRDILISSIESLLAVTAQFWSLSTLGSWIEIIRRARNSASDDDKTFEIDLCGQAIRFAFENPYLPTSGLVVEGFMSLYKSVTESNYVPETAAPLFSFWNWDKGRELREALVKKFIIGKWPPGDLGRAVPDFGLLKKILQRMSRRIGGHSFARKMYSDLASKDDIESRSLANNLANLLKNANYEEEWD